MGPSHHELLTLRRTSVAGRTGLVLTLATPVRVERPLGDPVHVTTRAIRADDADTLAGALRTARAAGAAPPAAGRRPGWLAPAALVAAVGTG